MNIDPEKHESCNCRICNLERELSASREAYLRSVERDDYLTQELAASKAEVERLKANLLRAVEIAVNLSWDYADTEYDAELDQLKATINQDNK